MKFYIYSITNPIDGNVIYIGKTNNYYLRWGTHLTCKGHNPRLNDILCQLIAADKEPVFNVLQQCTQEESTQIEKDWILKHIQLGHKLTNRLADAINQ